MSLHAVVRLLLVVLLAALALASTPARSQTSAPDTDADKPSAPATAAEADATDAGAEPATPAEEEVISEVRRPDGYMRMAGTSGANRNCGGGDGARTSLSLLENSSADGHCR